MTNKWLKEKANQILDKYTIDPNAKMENGLTASERLISYIIAALDNIERELD